MKKTFAQKVWDSCEKIPSGCVSTYEHLAKAVGSPKAFRAVGSALNKNPRAPIVPCHRVVKTDGIIGGFAHGEKKKRVLLQKEGIKVVNGKIEGFEKVLFNDFLQVG